MLVLQESINQMNSILRFFVSPSLRADLKQKRGRFSQIVTSLFFWKWRRFRFHLNESNLTMVHYLGRPEYIASIMALLGINPEINNKSVKANTHSDKVFASEFPIRNALCLPLYLTTIVKSNLPIDDIMANYSRSLRRSIAAQRAGYRYETVNDITKVDAIEREMLKPYATARHDVSAFQLDSNLVRKLALTKCGRLDLLFSGEEAVGCHLGNNYIYKGKRYWHVNRFGYPHKVSSDYKLWSEVNSINLHLALEAAIQNGYDYCDYGISLARPGSGLIEWKRRRKGFLSTYGNHNYIYLRLPKNGAAKFLWDSPLFSVENGKICLHLGIPEGNADEDVAARYHEMGYGGLSKVYLQCVQPPSERLIEMIRGLYADQESQPMIITYLVS
jgi:hypothetical protein